MSDTTLPDMRPPGGEKWDNDSYLAFGLTADHICRMWARYVDQTHPPPDHIANLIKGVTADVYKAATHHLRAIATPPELPPLPERIGSIRPYQRAPWVWCYSGEQMRAYAIEAITADRAKAAAPQEKP